MQIEEKDLQPNTVGTPGKIHTTNIAKKLKYRMEINSGHKHEYKSLERWQ
jgi:hypothetical protein